MLNNNDLLNLIDIEKVLHQLLLQIRTSTSSDAGTIYLKNGDCLKFCVFQMIHCLQYKLSRWKKIINF